MFMPSMLATSRVLHQGWPGSGAIGLGEEIEQARELGSKSKGAALAGAPRAHQEHSSRSWFEGSSEHLIWKVPEAGELTGGTCGGVQPGRSRERSRPHSWLERRHRCRTHKPTPTHAVLAAERGPVDGATGLDRRRAGGGATID